MSPPAFTIRPATMADYTALCELWAVLDEHHRLAKPDVFRKPASAGRERGEVQRLIDGPESTILVAEASGGVAKAFAVVIVIRRHETVVKPARAFAELDALVVMPDSRRRGLARALVEAADDWAKARGLGPLELAVHEFNAGAVAFYDFTRFSHRMALDEAEFLGRPRPAH